MTLDSLSGILGTPTKNPNMFNLISEVGDMRDLFRDLKENILEVEKSVRNINPAQIERDFDLVSARFSEMEENMMKREDLKKKEFKDNNKRVFEILQVLVLKQMEVKGEMTEFEKIMNTSLG